MAQNERKRVTWLRWLGSMAEARRRRCPGSSRDLDVAVVTPVGSPGVSDQSVVLAVLVAVADGGDGMVNRLAASGGVDDTAGVMLEDGAAGVNGDTNWLFG